MECLDDSIGIGEDFLDFLDFGLGFQGVVVQCCTLHLKVEVGTWKVIFSSNPYRFKDDFKGVLTSDGGHLFCDLDRYNRHGVNNLKCTIG